MNTGTVNVRVFAGRQDTALENARVTVAGLSEFKPVFTQASGAVLLELPEGNHTITVSAGTLPEKKRDVVADSAVQQVIDFVLDLELAVSQQIVDRDFKPLPLLRPRVGDIVQWQVSKANGEIAIDALSITSLQGAIADTTKGRFFQLVTQPGRLTQTFLVKLPSIDDTPQPPSLVTDNRVGPPVQFKLTATLVVDPAAGSNINTTLSRTTTVATGDLALWQAILSSTERLTFNNYLRFMDTLCGDSGTLRSRFSRENTRLEELRDRRLLPFTDTDAYRVVKAATEAFVMVNCGVTDDSTREELDGQLDYLARRDLPPAGSYQDYLVETGGVKALPYLAAVSAKLPESFRLRLTGLSNEQLSICQGLLQEKLANPCLMELIWSYWHEEGMLVQTINAITRRFQNMRSGIAPDPLGNLEIDPLRPLNNVLWGYVQDEQHRLTVVRRNYEYDHQYGLRLHGKAVRDMMPADSRSRFLEAFHNLLRLTTVFFKQDDDTTVKADAFPVLNALKEVHLILSQGAHNQFGDLTSTARIEQLMQAWLLARPEFREFLPTRVMVAYPEPWMDRVDAMKKLQGWTDTSVLHFRNLAIFGEQILLSIRYGNWNDVQEPLQAFNWQRFFRPQIQGYVHAYRAATGADLGADTSGGKVDSTPPSLLLLRQLEAQRRAS